MRSALPLPARPRPPPVRGHRRADRDAGPFRRPCPGHRVATGLGITWWRTEVVVLERPRQGPARIARTRIRRATACPPGDTPAPGPMPLSDRRRSAQRRPATAAGAHGPGGRMSGAPASPTRPGDRLPRPAHGLDDAGRRVGPRPDPCPRRRSPGPDRGGCDRWRGSRDRPRPLHGAEERTEPSQPAGLSAMTVAHPCASWRSRRGMRLRRLVKPVGVRAGPHRRGPARPSARRHRPFRPP
ncbi:hypothetical protein SAMN02745673_00285 [Marinactinospora thermotolerans DSM 45154]|uniref:Uncharacterized protein n=1 Tax=Marinactinospora thermotolerans DSM 45154 TaxID=1122192 RepID=A0A1T4KB02_9ACTN|nr:hypothetical protein SAMN02745673_00285 [Marinactinospora thermotolerans DSM 45154]